MYETFEHTADLGIRVQTLDFESLFVEAGQALFATIVENLETVKPLLEITLELANPEPALLLFDWLNELLFLFDTRHLLFGRFHVRVCGEYLIGEAWGEEIDTARHELNHEVKAITYHGLRVEPSESGWLAEFILDI